MWAVLSLLAAAAPGPHTIEVAPRTPLAVDISLSEGTTLDDDQQAVWIGHMQTVLKRISPLKAALARNLGGDPRTLASCRKQRLLRCWVQAVRPDYVFQASGQPAAPPPSGYRTNPRLLLILLVEAIPDDYQIRALLIDTDLALARFSAISQDTDKDDAWQRRVENEIYANAVVGRLDTPIALRAMHGTEGFFTKMFEETFQAALFGLGYDKPYGTMRIDTGDTPMDISVDGLTVGQTKTQPTLLINVPAGRHEIELSKPGCSIIQELVRIPAGKEISITQTPLCAAPTVQAQTEAPSSGLSPWIWVGLGVLVAAAGAGAAVAVASSSGPDYRTTFSP